jgi:hypothetical protein
MSGADDFDRWVADEGGPEAAVAMIADLSRQIDSGDLPGFTNRDDFEAYLRRPDRRSA